MVSIYSIIRKLNDDDDNNIEAVLLVTGQCCYCSYNDFLKYDIAVCFVLSCGCH